MSRLSNKALLVAAVVVGSCLMPASVNVGSVTSNVAGQAEYIKPTGDVIDSDAASEVRMSAIMSDGTKVPLTKCFALIP